MSDVFISYARSSQTKAELVEDALKALGYSVWRDRELPLHRPYPQVIEEQLRAAKAVIVLWSRDAAASDWVRSEADAARLSAKLVQVSLDGAAPPMPFDQIHCGDLGAWSGDPTAEGWRRLLGSLDQLTQPRPRSHAATASAEPLLAVLPFDNLSGDADLLYFSDGLSEEILQTVARTTRLRVIGRSSSFQFRGAAKAAHRVAAELNCTHMLDGSVRRSGERVRVAASLIECDQQTLLWSDRFDRDLADVFALQDEIAAAVADALNHAFAPSPQLGPIDPEAYELYLRARAKTMEAVVGPEAADWMAPADVGLLEAALKRAPRFTQGWSELALAKAVLAQSQPTQPGFDALAGEARGAALQALALDDKAGAALTAESLLLPLCGRYADRERLLSQARASSGGDEFVLFQSSVFAARVGRIGEALDFASEAYRLNPINPHTVFWRANMLFTAGRHAEAFALWDEGRARWPSHPGMTAVAMYYAAAAGDWPRAEALAAAAQSEPLLPTERLARGTLEANLAAVALLRDHPAGARQDLVKNGRAEIRATGTIQFQFVGFVSLMGFTDAAYDLVAAASFTHLQTAGHPSTPASGSPHTLFDPQNAALRADPRFVALCADLGLCRYWLDSGRWPDCATQTRYDFRAAARVAAGTQG